MSQTDEFCTLRLSCGKEVTLRDKSFRAWLTFAQILGCLVRKEDNPIGGKWWVARDADMHYRGHWTR